MIQLKAERAKRRASASAINNLQRTFLRQSCVKIPRFLSPELLREVQNQLTEKDFYDRMDSHIAFESCMKKNPLFCFMHFLLNDETIFRWIESLTGCEKIQCFQGRLYRMVPGKDHYDTWHNDMDDQRLVGISINLSREPFRGGYLEIREEATQKIKSRTANTVPGNAVVFQISDTLKHRVTPVQGKHPRIAFVGWFQRSPKFSSILK
jgi:Rps23 Pro-64 3,4-dihydroxylase Tpa1-like proline 4-hydroxylase